MLTPNREIITQAKQMLTGKWKSVIATVFVFLAIVVSLEALLNSGTGKKEESRKHGIERRHDMHEDESFKKEIIREIKDAFALSLEEDNISNDVESYDMDREELHSEGSWFKKEIIRKIKNAVALSLEKDNISNDDESYDMDREESHGEESWLLKLATVLYMAPLSLGLVIYFLAFTRNNNPKLEILFFGFKQYGTALFTTILRNIFVILYLLLLIVPGIIAAISYSLSYYLITDNPSLSSREVLSLSKKMMYGNRAKYFGLYLRFIGWFLLCIITIGVALLWVIPYFKVSEAKFYEDVLANYNENNASREEQRT